MVGKKYKELTTCFFRKLLKCVNDNFKTCQGEKTQQIAEKQIDK